MNQPHTAANQASPLPTSSFRPVPRTGVIFVVSEAAKLGFHVDAEDWCNLGQGQPEAGPLPGAPNRISHLDISEHDNEYAPVPGLWEMREAVAHLYNQQYRRGMPSQYTAENVAICGGGRTGLTRTTAALGHINLGHFLPDYTAYEELLDVFRSFAPIPILLDGDEGYDFSVEALRKEILGRGLGALLISNPCNPTGKLIHGDALGAWVDTARELDCAMLIDEFYGNYIWEGEHDTVSAARYVEDVDRDPVVLFNGLTKNWRYPGWRVCWTVGPKSIIDAVASAGSFLDGGASRPLQRAALPLLEPDNAAREAQALHNSFSRKRSLMLAGLTKLGVQLEVEPGGTFYAWGRLDQLPAHLADGMSFFRQALKHKVIVVPGEFFDVNPGKRRPGRASRFKPYARFSFGPSEASVVEGLRRLEQMIHG